MNIAKKKKCGQSLHSLVPDFQSFFLPMLSLTADGKVHSLQETYGVLADHFKLTDADQKEMLPRQAIYKNRIAWARTYLVIRSNAPRNAKERGPFRITARGKELLPGKPATLRVYHLKAIARVGTLAK